MELPSARLGITFWYRATWSRYGAAPRDRAPVSRLL